MPDIIADGRPFESSLDTANDFYASTPPSFGREFGSLYAQQPAAGLGRSFERSRNEDASWFDKALLGVFTQDAADAGVKLPEPIQTPQLTADEANNWYAPPGTKITDKPISQGLAQVIGRQKREAMEREGVIARAQAVHSWPRNFLVGMTAFTLDPVNAATLFVPGVGEETVTAALGRGAIARVAGRAVSGATGAAAAQIPLSALRYGMDHEEAGDYSARAALTDVFYAAAGGAILQAGFGSIGDFIRARRAAAKAREQPPLQPTESQIGQLPPEVNAAAMRASVSQVLDGRPVDVLPVIDANAVRLISREAELRNQVDQLGFQLVALPKTKAETDAVEKLTRLEAVERNLAEEGISPERQRELQQRRDEILADTTPEKLRLEAAPSEIRRGIENQKAQLEKQIADVALQRAQARLDSAGQQPGLLLQKLADAQTQIYRNGYASSVPQNEFNATYDGIYGAKAAETQGPAERPALPAEATSAKAPAKEGAPVEAKPATPEEKEAADLEAQWQRAAATNPAMKLSPEQMAEIQQAINDYSKSQKAVAGINQAAFCLDEAGV